jgi:hypothetical protein
VIKKYLRVPLFNKQLNKLERGGKGASRDPKEGNFFFWKRGAHPQAN